MKKLILEIEKKLPSNINVYIFLSCTILGMLIGVYFSVLFFSYEI